MCEAVLWLLQVVLMNQVTTKVLDNNRGSKLVPALGGESLIVRRSHAIRYATLQCMQPFHCALFGMT